MGVLRHISHFPEYFVHYRTSVSCLFHPLRNHELMRRHLKFALHYTKTASKISRKTLALQESKEFFPFSDIDKSLNVLTWQKKQRKRIFSFKRPVILEVSGVRVLKIQLECPLSLIISLPGVCFPTKSFNSANLCKTF